MHSTNNSNTVKLDKWDDNAALAVAIVAVAVVVVVEMEVVMVARRNGHIMQIDLAYNAGHTSSIIWHDEKINSEMKTKRTNNTN